MSTSSKRFLTAILGATGTKALSRATSIDSGLESVVVPRVALSWVQSKGEYAGKIPGQSNSFVKFSKNEQGFTGLISVTEELNYAFEDATPEHVASAIAVSLGADRTPVDSIRSVTIARLGKAVDSLFKAQQDALALNEVLDKKMLDPSLGSVYKTELPGATAAPRPPEGPSEPEDPAKQKGQKPKDSIKLKPLAGQKPGPKLPKLKTLQPSSLKLERSETSKECKVCGGYQFKDVRFVGCLCHRDLAKNIQAIWYGDGVVLEFRNVPPTTVLALRKTFKE